MLPPRVKSLIKTSGHLAHQRLMGSVRANIASSNNIIRHSAARQVDEVGPEAAMAIEKVLRLPT
jgi:hypothetical protein